MSYSSENVIRWRTSTKQRMIDSMGGCCQICGYSKSLNALEFHHIDPTLKDFGIGGQRSNPKSWVKMISELKKCILLCSNCHKEFHSGITELPEEYAKFNEEYTDYNKQLNEIFYSQCPVCFKNKPINMKTCSKSCASQFNKNIDWSTIDIIKLKENHSFKEIGDIVGASAASVWKRYKKLNIIIPG